MIRLFGIRLFSTLIGLSAATIGCAEGLEASNQLNIYGQINRGILSFDDGQEQDIYPFVDNSKSVSRIGFTYDTPLQSGWDLRAIGEVGLTWKQTNFINQTNPYASNYVFDKTALRKLDFALSHPDHGTFSFGQGSMASDGITGQDLSLTTVVAGTAVKDVAGGFYFRKTDGTLSTFRILERFRAMGGSRRLRFGYETPERNGYKIAAAVGRDVLVEKDGRYYADIAARYDGTIGDYRLKAGVALRYAGGYPDTQFRETQLNFIASGSVLHKPSRFNFTMAYGNALDEGYYIYSKLGRRWYKLLPWGWTAASVDYYYTKDGPDLDRIGRSVGLALVQQVKASDLDLYATVRKYQYDDSEADYLDSVAILTGVRWRF